MSDPDEQPDIDEFVSLCKLLVNSSAETTSGKDGWKLLDWHELRILWVHTGLAVKWRSLDGTFVSRNWLYDDREETWNRRYVVDIREIRRHLPALRKATLLDKLADV